MPDDDRIIGVIAELLYLTDTRDKPWETWEQALAADPTFQDDYEHAANHLLAALRRNNIEPVELPKPDSWDESSWWESSVRVLDSSSNRQYPIAIEAVPGEVQLVDIGYAREFAGALLAAAQKAEERT
jgi:hypothetical protein